jgi:hypothetical protein
MMKLTTEEQMVLLTMHEYSPLWEFIEAMRPLVGGASPVQLRVRIADVLRDFAARGWLQLHRQPVNLTDAEGNATVVNLALLEAILHDEKNWQVPRDRNESAFDLYIFDTTPLAESLIKDGVVDDVWPGGVNR